MTGGREIERGSQCAVAFFDGQWAFFAGEGVEGFKALSGKANGQVQRVIAAVGDEVECFAVAEVAVLVMNVGGQRVAVVECDARRTGFDHQLIKRFQ